MALKEDQIESLIIRFLQRQSDEKEISDLKEWVNLSENNLKSFHQIQDLWNSVEVDRNVTENTIEQKWSEIEQKINPFKVKKTVPENGIYKLSRWSYLKAVAIFIFGIFVSYAMMQLIGSDRELVYHEIVTPLGSKTVINLSDGSKVWLNAGSKFKYPERFDSNQRDVFLEGEAYFSVSKSKKKKFTVNTEDFIIKVYGTEFNVKSYPDDNTSETTLVEGSISITRKQTKSSKETEEIVLQPNQRLVMYKRSNKEIIESKDQMANQHEPIHVKPKRRLIISKGIDTNEFVSWKDGTLTIKSETMADLAKKIERRFDVIIVFRQDEIKDYSYSGIITNETLEQVMTAIKLASPIDYSIDDGIITLSLNPGFEDKNKCRN